MPSFILAIFLSAFLLFQIQPIIARFILPAYGGSPAVWTSCMMFFQLGLLLGYFYAHVLATRLKPKQQVTLHLTLLALSLLLMPVGVADSWQPDVTGFPALDIFTLLAISTGIPFTLISASGPLLQHWFAGAQPGKSPFRLYAVSNLGSLLALLSYPFLIEPNFSINAQANTWSVGFGVLLPLFLICGIAYFRAPATEYPDEDDSSLPQVSPTDKLLWVALAACGSTLLLATTNQISIDIAVVPFLWILPLSIYLITFIICFDSDHWYNRTTAIPLTIVAVGILTLFILEEVPSHWDSIAHILPTYTFALFCCCMICHGELARSRSHVRHLTTFYLYVALGGALGGVFVNIVAPLLFNVYWEFHIGLVSTFILAGICLIRDKEALGNARVRQAFFLAWPILTIGLASALTFQVIDNRSVSIHIERSFFGVMYVDEFDTNTSKKHRALYHGSINHGVQFTDPKFERLTTTYFGMDTGAGLALINHPNRLNRDIQKRKLNIGIIGLGIGTLSAYGKEQDTMRFYEIDPQVEYIANEYFTYLKNCKADVDVVLGDARITMQQELDENGSNQFDVLILDAFSGDSIPIHLLTEEAFDLYDKHLKEDGIIAAHISNRYVNLKPVLVSNANRLRSKFFLIENGGKRWYEKSNDWVILTRNEQFAESRKLQQLKSKFPTDMMGVTTWTDDFSNLFEVIYWE